MKSLAKAVIVSILGWQVRRLRKKHKIKVIVVAGSAGKTSTKFAIARLLEGKYKVYFQEGNYNVPLSVPLVFFNKEMPSLFNPLAWLGTIIDNERIIRRDYPYDLVVIEVGTDGPGQIRQFESFLKADLGILTAIAPEHMEFFADLDAVAEEEADIQKLTNKLAINLDMVEAKYQALITKPRISYSLKKAADVQLTNINYDGFSSSFEIFYKGKLWLSAKHELVTEPLLQAVAGAVTVAIDMGLTADEITTGLQQIKPVKGRMQKLDGVSGSIIIDDTYNASPPAVKAALDTLYRLKAPQKIAVLGNMNELGQYSKAEHKQVGDLCDPAQLDLVVTIGPEANQFLAPAAEAKGCRVETFDNPYEAGQFVKQKIRSGALVLVKGSQNRVFAEETVKQLLKNPNDSEKLVRQTADWMRRKNKAFGGKT